MVICVPTFIVDNDKRYNIGKTAAVNKMNRAHLLFIINVTSRSYFIYRCKQSKIETTNAMEK